MGFETRTSLLGRALARVYHRLPMRQLALRIVSRVEGGPMYSMTLRNILAKYYNVHVGAYSYGSLLEPGRADVKTSIGRYCSIGPNVRRIGAAHPVEHLSLHPFWYNPRLKMVGAESDVERLPCVIGDDVWIGANVTILPGCREIGTGAVIGAGAVVTKNVSQFEIVAGNPARKIGERLTGEQRARLLSAAPWDRSPEDMHKWLLSIDQEGTA